MTTKGKTAQDYEAEIAHGWSASQIGALMIAATAAADAIVSMWRSDHNEPMPPDLAAIVEQCRVAVSRGEDSTTGHTG